MRLLRGSIGGERNRILLAKLFAKPANMGEAIDQNDIRRPSGSAAAQQRALAAPGGVATKVAFSQDKYFPSADSDRLRPDRIRPSTVTTVTAW